MWGYIDVLMSLVDLGVIWGTEISRELSVYRYIGISLILVSRVYQYIS